MSATQTNQTGNAPVMKDSTNPPETIALMGAPISSSNRGVLALSSSTLALIKQAYPEARIVILTGNKDNKPHTFRTKSGSFSVPVINKRMSPKSKPSEHMIWIMLLSLVYRLVKIKRIRAKIENSIPWIRTVSTSTLVCDIRGGDSFSDIYGLFKFLSACLPRLSVILIGKKLTHLPQTFGPFKHSLSIAFAKKLVKSSTKAIARDTESLNYLKELLPDHSDKFEFCPDVAFTLPPIPPDEISFDDSVARVWGKGCFAHS